MVGEPDSTCLVTTFGIIVRDMLGFHPACGQNGYMYAATKSYSELHICGFLGAYESSSCIELILHASWSFAAVPFVFPPTHPSLTQLSHSPLTHSVPEALEVAKLKSHLCQVQEDPTKFCEACGHEGCEEGGSCVMHLVVVEGTMVLNLG